MCRFVDQPFVLETEAVNADSMSAAASGSIVVGKYVATALAYVNIDPGKSMRP